MNGRGTTLVAILSFAAGLGAANLSSVAAPASEPLDDLATREFRVFVDEVKQNFVFAEPFVGHYSRTFTLSDGTTRTIELTPMVSRGMQVVELKDGRHLSYMGLNGRTTNGTLMIHIQDVRESRRQMREAGWPEALTKDK